MFGRVLRKVLGINFHRQTVLLLLYNVTYVYLLCALLFFVSRDLLIIRAASIQATRDEWQASVYVLSCSIIRRRMFKMA